VNSNFKLTNDIALMEATTRLQKRVPDSKTSDAPARGLEQRGFRECGIYI
jgi:hypothetical protein